MNKSYLYVGAAAAGLALAYVLYRKGSQAAAAVATAVNPVSDQNLAYKGASAVTQAATGGKYLSLGDALYGWLNPSKDQTGVSSSSGANADLGGLNFGLLDASGWDNGGSLGSLSSGSSAPSTGQNAVSDGWGLSP